MEPIRLPWWLYGFLGVICIYILYLLYRDGKKDLELEYIRGRFDGLDDNGQPRKFISEPTPETIKRAEEREKIQDERYFQALEREKERSEQIEASEVMFNQRWQQSREQNEEIIELLRKIALVHNPDLEVKIDRLNEFAEQIVKNTSKEDFKPEKKA